MESTPSVPVTPRPRGWFARNWRWFVPTVVIVLLLACCGLPVGIALSLASLKQTQSYQTALKRVQQDPQVVERLGKPIDEAGVSRWMPSGTMHVEGNRGDAHWDIDVAGPKGTAHVRTQSRMVGGRWEITVLDVTFSDGKKLQLDSAAGDDAPKFGGSGDAPKFGPPGGAAPKSDAPKPDAPKGPPAKEAPKSNASGPPGTDIKLDIPM